jgi:hypothetical protein
MLTKIEIRKTYWVGVAAEQKDDLLSAVLKAVDADASELTKAEIEVLSGLRLALLNA